MENKPHINHTHEKIIVLTFVCIYVYKCMYSDASILHMLVMHAHINLLMLKIIIKIAFYGYITLVYF